MLKPLIAIFNALIGARGSKTFYTDFPKVYVSHTKTRANAHT